MKTERRERCTSCGALLHDPTGPGGPATTVHEHDKEIVLVHCPRCATLLVKITKVPLHAS